MSLQSIGPYRVQRQIGGGRESVVYLATSPDGDWVAVKMIGSKFLSAEAVETFFELVQALYNARVASLVPIVDMGQLHGNPYVVTTYLDGGTLGEHLTRGALDPADTAVILQRLAEAVDAWHAAGFAHPDLGAQTVLFDEQGRSYLGGLGSYTWGDEDTRSPEQKEGLPPNAASNIYSLGVLLYMMLAGRPPGPGAPQDLRARRPELPSGIDSVLARALSTIPEERFPTASALAEAFTVAVLDEPEGAFDEPLYGTPAEWEMSLGEAPAVDEMSSASLAELLNATEPGEAPPPTRNWRPFINGAAVFVVVALLVVAGIAFVSSRNDGLPTPVAAIDVFALTRAAYTPTPLPPEVPGIRVIAPVEGVTLDVGTTITVGVVVSDPIGVRAVNLTANGQTIGNIAAGGEKIVRVVREWTPRVAGLQTVEVNAVNRAGEAQTAVPRTIRVIDRAMLERNAPVWQRVEGNVSALRGLPPLEGVTPTLLSRIELRQRIRSAFDYTEAQATRDVLVLNAFDFVPRNFDLYNEASRYFGDNIAGFYDPATNEFVVVSDDDIVDPLEQLTHAHEFMHALQDQHYGLSLQGEAGVGFEEDLALRALAEGEAEWLTSLYVDAGFFSDAELVALFNESSLQLSLGSTGGQSNLPAALGRAFLFPYVEGRLFVQVLYSQGGWAAVDRAWANPPRSTEQILHPERYLAGDAPRAVTIAPLEATLGDGWALLADGVFGELFLREYLAQALPEAEVDAAATGWGGDRYAIYWRPTDAATVLVYRMLWDTVGDANQFTAAYRSYGDGRFGGVVEFVADGGSCWVGGTVTCLYQFNEESVIVRAPDLATAVALAADARR